MTKLELETCLSFRAHIRKYIHISDIEFETIIPYFDLLKLKRKQIIQHAYQTTANNFFVLQGCLRMYTIHPKGNEITTDFGLENWWICDQKAYCTKTYSDSDIQAVESSIVLKLSRENELKLIDAYPQIRNYFLQITQKALAAAQFRIKLFKLYSKEEIFKQFSDNYPEFMQRVPQYLIASYLGLTPEYVSEIRKKMIS